MLSLEVATELWMKGKTPALPLRCSCFSIWPSTQNLAAPVQVHVTRPHILIPNLIGVRSRFGTSPITLAWSASRTDTKHGSGLNRYRFGEPLFYWNSQHVKKTTSWGRTKRQKVTRRVLNQTSMWRIGSEHVLDWGTFFLCFQGLFRGAAAVLKPHGLLLTYGVRGKSTPWSHDSVSVNSQ